MGKLAEFSGFADAVSCEKAGSQETFCEDVRRLFGCAFRSLRSIILAMEEVLSKTIDPKTLLEEMEFYELSLLDEANELGTRHCIRQAHVAWNEIEGDLMSDHEEVEYFWILTAAKQRYEERRRALADKGFIYSDMDPIL
jgi:hypothetical protein